MHGMGMSDFVHGQSQVSKSYPISFTVSRRCQNHIRFRSRLLFTFASPSAVPIPIAARSKTWVYGRSLAGIAGSNPAYGMDVCLL